MSAQSKTRIAIDLPNDTYWELKTRAKTRQITLRQLFLELAKEDSGNQAVDPSHNL
jgi:predicted DNA-binding ribbon-helix-helix protein